MATEAQTIRAIMDDDETPKTRTFVRPDTSDGFPKLDETERDSMPSLQEVMERKPIDNEADFQRLKSLMIKMGREGMPDMQWTRRMKSLRDWRAAHAAPEETPEEQAPPEPTPAGIIDRTLALPDVAATLISGAGAEIPAGIAGLAALAAIGIDELITGGTTFNPDLAVNTVNNVRDMFTWNPMTKTGAAMITAVTAPLMAADNAVISFSETISDTIGGGEGTSTSIYTTIMGGLTFVGVGKFSKIVPRQKLARQIRTVRREIAAYAKDKGIILKQNKIVDSAIKAVENSVPKHRAANALLLRDALQEQLQASKNATQHRVNAAHKRDAMVAAQRIEVMGHAAEEALLREGFDVQRMPLVQQHLRELQTIAAVSPISGVRPVPTLIKKPKPLVEPKATRKSAQKGDDVRLTPEQRRHMESIGGVIKKQPKSKKKPTPDEQQLVALSEIQRVRDRIDKSRSKTKSDSDLPDSVNENLALRNLTNQIDDMMDSAFTKDLMSGDPLAVAGWIEANAARSAHNARWNKKSAVARLARHDATAPEVRSLLMGMSVVGPKGSASRVLNQLKEVLGKDHPAIQGITADFVHEMTKPLLQTTPNLKLFLSNFKKTLDNDPALITALNLSQHEITQLRNFVDLAHRTPSTSRKAAFIDMLPSAVARFTVGHGIAKAGLKVSMFANALKVIIGKDQITRRALLHDLVGNQIDVPVLAPRSLSMQRVARDAFLIDWESAQRQGK